MWLVKLTWPYWGNGYWVLELRPQVIWFGTCDEAYPRRGFPGHVTARPHAMLTCKAVQAEQKSTGKRASSPWFGYILKCVQSCGVPGPAIEAENCGISSSATSFLWTWHLFDLSAIYLSIYLSTYLLPMRAMNFFTCVYIYFFINFFPPTGCDR